MYLTQLNEWNESKWDKQLSYFDLSKSEASEVMQILTLPQKHAIEGNFERLCELGIINGIGPGYVGRWFRRILTVTFSGVQYEWHDINYFIGGTESDRLYADYGLLKYSIQAIIDNWYIVLMIDENPLSKLITWIARIMASLIQLLIALVCFIMVVAFGRFGSFEYTYILNDK